MMDELKEGFEIMLKQIHALRGLIEKALQVTRQKGYNAGYKEGLRMANLGKTKGK